MQTDLQHEIDNLVSQPDLFDNTLQSGFPVFDTSENVCVPHNVDVRSDRRLGHRAEDLLAVWLHCHPRYDIVVHGLQVISEKRTLGELDFILFDKHEQCLVHLELVCKFYVYIPELHNHNSIDAWWGPKFQDNLSLKLHKLRSKQFPLLYSPEAQEIFFDRLQEKNIDSDTPCIQKLCFKAFLFVPAETMLAPTDIPADCIVGTWIRESDVDNFFGETTPDAIPKLQWLQKIR